MKTEKGVRGCGSGMLLTGAIHLTSAQQKERQRALILEDHKGIRVKILSKKEIKKEYTPERIDALLAACRANQYRGDLFPLPLHDDGTPRSTL